MCFIERVLCGVSSLLILPDERSFYISLNLTFCNSILSQAKTKKLCGSGNPTLPRILVPTLIFFVLLKKNIKKSRYCSVQLAIRFGTVR